MKCVLFVFLVASLIACTYADEETISKCDQPPAQVGYCRASTTRFSYYKESGKCSGFDYGGCGGNANNFPTEMDCQQACKPKVE